MATRYKTNRVSIIEELRQLALQDDGFPDMRWPTNRSMPIERCPACFCKKASFMAKVCFCGYIFC